MPCGAEETPIDPIFNPRAFSLTSNSDSETASCEEPTYPSNNVGHQNIRNESIPKNQSGDSVDSLWTKLVTTNEIPPRAAHSCEFMGDSYVVVFGGWNGTEALNDLHILDLNEMRWFTVETENTPSKRNNVSETVNLSAKRELYCSSMPQPSWATDSSSMADMTESGGYATYTTSTSIHAFPE